MEKNIEESRYFNENDKQNIFQKYCSNFEIGGKMMKALLKFKWPISILVIIVIALSLFSHLIYFNLQKVKLSLRDDTTSQKYEQMLKDVGANSNSMVAVIDLKKPINSNGNDQLESYIKN